jgi:L-aminopeptidase/D-esterase-like protein
MKPGWTILGLMALAAVNVAAGAAPRARDLGIPFDGTPGPLNAITDIAGVTVGHTTLVSGEGKLRVGVGPVRTGVTAVLPRGQQTLDSPVFAGWYSLNGNGEMTGTTWVEESGFLEGPVMITNTHSVGVVRDAVIQWRVARGNPVGREIEAPEPYAFMPSDIAERGSIIVVVATDTPCCPISSSAWRGASRWDSAATGVFRATAQGTCS